MQEVFNWLLENWRVLLILIQGIISFVAIVVVFIKKKSFNVVDSFDSDLYRYCIAAVNKAERVGDLSGSDKLEFAVKYVIEKVSTYYPKLLDNSFLIDLVKLTIEEILSTPHKKGD